MAIDIYRGISKPIVGTDDVDIIYGRGGNDIIHGNGGDDQIWGGPGWDKIYGGSGNDQIFGDHGNGMFTVPFTAEDKLYGEDGDDVLSGQGGDDKLFGGKGADRLLGGSGNDWLVGGPGSDVFVFEPSPGGPGDDVIADFVTGVDQIDLSALGITLDEITAWSSGSNTILGIDTDFDGTANFQITLLNALAPAVGDYVL